MKIADSSMKYFGLYRSRYYCVHFQLLQVFAIELVTFAVDFIQLAEEFSAFAVEFIGFAVEFVGFAVEFRHVCTSICCLGNRIRRQFRIFVIARLTSWNKHENKM